MDSAPVPEDLRVVLGASTARVRRGGVETEAPIHAALPGEDVGVVLARATGDAVVVREGAEDAVVRIGGEQFEAVPLFRERNVADEAGTPRPEEVRVKVEAVRVKGTATPTPEPERKGLLGRLFGGRR